MKLFNPVILLAAISLLSCACVSRTTTTEKGYGEDLEEKKIIWFWQDEFRKPK